MGERSDGIAEHKARMNKHLLKFSYRRGISVILIRSMRLRQGRTEAQLARSAAVERSHLSRIERDRVKPNLETVLRLLRELGAESIFVNVLRNREK